MVLVKDYLLSNGLAEESEWGVSLLSINKSLDDRWDCDKINQSKLTEQECKIYLGILINYFSTYQCLDDFKFYLYCENDLWDIFYEYETDGGNPYDEESLNVINYLHDLMIIVLPKVSGLNHLANNLINDWKGNK
jgi:hypothetical protein